MGTAANTVSDALLAGLAELPDFAGGAVDEAALAATLTRYIALLAKWNKAYNLTAVRDPLEMVTRHMLDSLSTADFLHGDNILDAGTGAGLPGIPLALVYPARQFTLLDSNGKKIRFVQQAVSELGIANVRPVHARVEDFAAEQLFDTVVSRAFTAIPDFVAGCGRLVAPGGRLLAMKGKLPVDELARLPEGWRVALAEPVKVPGQAAERHMIVLEH